MASALHRKRDTAIERRMHRRVFNPCTPQDRFFDKTMQNLSGETLLAIVTRIREEFLNKVVDLSNENIRTKAAEVVGLCLQDSPCTKLDLSSNYIRDTDITLIFGSVLENSTRSAPSSNRQQKSEAKSKTLALEELNLANNRIGFEGAAVISGILKHSKLHTLILDTNAISGQGIEAIATALSSNKSHLKTFSASWNNLSAKAVIFGKTLKVNRSLALLQLGYCNLGDDVAEALATGLKYNSVLEELFLFGNLITDVGGQCFVECLSRSNKKLRYLNLANNLITDTSAKKFVELLHKRNNTDASTIGSIFVNLQSNEQITEAVVLELDRIRELLQRKTTRVIAADEYHLTNSDDSDDESAAEVDSVDGDQKSDSSESEEEEGKGNEDITDTSKHVKGQSEYLNYFNNKFYEIDGLAPATELPMTAQDAGPLPPATASIIVVQDALDEDINNLIARKSNLSGYDVLL